jgi:ribosomal protein S18 acetylase RimI-like enzyme
VTVSCSVKGPDCGTSFFYLEGFSIRIENYVVDKKVGGDVLDTKIAVLSLENLEECTELYTCVFNGEPWNDGWEEEDARERLLDIFSNRKFWGIGIYDKEQKMIGFLVGYTEKWLSNHHFYLNEMCVKSELQGRGIGSKLIKELDVFCDKNDINCIYLLTAKDGQAEAFYKKNGFYVSPKMIMMSKSLEI